MTREAALSRIQTIGQADGGSTRCRDPLLCSRGPVSDVEAAGATGFSNAVVGADSELPHRRFPADSGLFRAFLPPQNYPAPHEDAEIQSVCYPQRCEGPLPLAEARVCSPPASLAVETPSG